ncbi:MAG: hypothetical protein KKF50_01665 [Nanoarchaeota archaeon]|nr:hypothetical protein [Nanoarchaeota archaeon]
MDEQVEYSLLGEVDITNVRETPTGIECTLAPQGKVTRKVTIRQLPPRTRLDPKYNNY